ncbi:hypothetical protein P3T76_010140 [Phytophthora citrophthora]|uniref:Uncharacterized protein n=1 Tax=Phytophthora citrophthora TaxID=4793 RepID=A0AAD9GEB7_9STRA|nr:hypothetical protein P3T76_010140 [Phytophthora citrophthora]
MSLLKSFDLDDILRAIPARRAAGRPRKSRRSLDRDENDTKFFSRNNLIQILTSSPGYVFHWSVVKECPVKKGGTVTEEHFAGRATIWQKNKGRFSWFVHFTNNEILLMQCQDLVELLSCRYDMGLNVDGLTE